MKNTLTLNVSLCLVAISLMSVGSHAQSKPTSEGDYNGTIMYAVSETNFAYQVIFGVEIEEFFNGKSFRKVIETVENESEGRSRKRVITVEGGNRTEVSQILLSFGNYYCRKKDGGWTKSQYECSGPLRVSLPRKPESVKYSVEDTKIDGKSVKVYRKYSVFSFRNKKSFEEEIATIDSNGYFISVVDNEGTLNPKVITRTQKQTWITKAKINPITAPIN